MCRKIKLTKIKRLVNCFLVFLLVVICVFNCVQVAALDSLDSSEFEFEDFSDESFITPLWNKEGHESTVDDYGTQLTAFLKTMSIVPDNKNYTLSSSLENGNYMVLDSEDGGITLSNGSKFTYGENFTLRKLSILHGGGNYVASLKFLYSVARNLVNKEYEGIRVQRIQTAINDSLGANDVLNNTFMGDNQTYCINKFNWDSTGANGISSITISNKFSALKQRLVLEKSIYVVANTFFEGQGKAFEEVKQKYSNVTDEKIFDVKVALKIIGIATHLCGDIYAHKTVVPLDTEFVANVVPTTRDNETIYKGTDNDFNGNGRWDGINGIKTLIESGSPITTQQIRLWQLGETNKVRTGYPDCPNFYGERLTVGATQLVENMYDNYFNDKSLLAEDKFFVNWFLHTNYSLKLANLKLFTYTIGEQPTLTTRLERLDALDSAVAVSCVYPASGVHTTPNDSVNTWNKGYVSSYSG